MTHFKLYAYKYVLISKYMLYKAEQSVIRKF